MGNSITTLVSTKSTFVTSNIPIDSTELELCNQAETDTRKFFHLLNVARSGYQKILLKPSILM